MGEIIQKISIEDIAIAINSDIKAKCNKTKDIFINHISTDSRDSIDSSSLFIAIDGKKEDASRFDAHDYIDSVYNKGCRVFVIERDVFDKDKHGDAIVLIVEDSINALGNIAKLYKKKFNIPFIAITGSCGKTTVKDLISFFLSLKYKTLKTHGNLNNEIGVPKTIFTLEPDDEIAVLETAMNHEGELRRIGKIVEPDCIVINNIEHVHIEFFKAIKNIAKAKSEIFEHASQNCIAIINNDTNCIDVLLNKANHNDIKNIITFSIDEATSIEEKSFIYKDIKFKHNLIGKFNITNIIAALKVAEYYNVCLTECAKNLENFLPSKNRMETINISNTDIINDTYNSNPKALKEMLIYLHSVDKKIKIAVIGDMLELGIHSKYHHKEIAETINALNIDYVYTIGKEAKYIHDNLKNQNKNHFDDIPTLSQYLKEKLKEDTIVLIKASRGCRLETLIKTL